MIELMLRFKYKTLPTKMFGKDTKNPVIPLFIIGPTVSDRLDFLLDSGADSTAITEEIAEGFGIQKGKETPVAGVSGPVKAWEGKLKFIIEHHTYPRTVHEIPCKIVQNKDMPPVIGRQPFFDWFEINFKQKEQRIELKPLQQPRTK